jgi:thiol-disulfide isomerase/thioredoxin
VSAPAPGLRRFAGALFATGLVALCTAGGFLVYHATRPERARLYPVPAAPPAAELAGPPPAAAHKIPEELPPLVLPALHGAPSTLQGFRGQLLVVNFWATWCVPCRREIPLLQHLQREHAKDGVEIVGIAVDHRQEVAKYAEEHHIAYPLLVGEQGGLEMVKALGMDTVLPFSVFADRAGRIVTLKIGELHPEEAEFILARMMDLDQGRMDLAAAREQISTGIAQLNATRSPAAGSGPN